MCVQNICIRKGRRTYFFLALYVACSVCVRACVMERFYTPLLSPLLGMLRISSAISFQNLLLLLHSSPVAGKPGHDHCRLQDNMHSNTDTHMHANYSVLLDFHMLRLISQMNALSVTILSHKSSVISNQLLSGNTESRHTCRA